MKYSLKPFEKEAVITLCENCHDALRIVPESLSNAVSIQEGVVPCVCGAPTEGEKVTVTWTPPF